MFGKKFCILKFNLVNTFFKDFKKLRITQDSLKEDKLLYMYWREFLKKKSYSTLKQYILELPLNTPKTYFLLFFSNSRIYSVKFELWPLW